MNHDAWTPQRILETSGSYWTTCALHTAVELDLFTRIGDGREDVVGLSRQANADEDAMARLLDTLCASGLLVRDGRWFKNTSASRVYLCADSKDYLGFIIRHHHYLMASWARLPEAIRSGKPVRDVVRDKGYREREAFLMGMFNLAMQLAPKLVPAVDLSGRRRLLDLGGGPGTYAIHFCQHYPDLSATVMDLPTTRPFAEETICRMNLQRRIDYFPGDFLTDELPGGYDVVWMSHILHGESADDCQRIVDKAAGCLRPGGLAVIHEFILDDTRDGPLFPALFSLNMLLATNGGRAYTQAELNGMLDRAGLETVQRIDFSGPNESGLLRAVKPV